MNDTSRIPSLRPRAARPSLARAGAVRPPAMVSWSFVGSLTVHAVAFGGLAWWALEGSGPAREQRTLIVAAPGPVEALAELAPESEPDFAIEEPLPADPTLVEIEMPPTIDPPDDPPPSASPWSPDREVFAHILSAPWTIDATRRRDDVVAATAAAAPAPALTPTPVPVGEMEPAEVVREPVFVAATKLTTPEPVYPRLSRRLGEEGTVELRLKLGPDGRVLDITISSSSGFSRLDDAAVEAVRAWTFEPATRDGVAVESSFDHRFVFQLHAS